MTCHSNSPGRALIPALADGERHRVALVYQAGIANVFRVDCFNLSPDGRNARRVVQGDFHTCEAIAYGMAMAGAIVHSLACNRAGDVADAQWSEDLDSQPFAEKFHPVKFTRGV